MKKKAEGYYMEKIDKDALEGVAGGIDIYVIDGSGGNEIDWDEAGNIEPDIEAPNSKPYRGGFSRVK